MEEQTVRNKRPVLTFVSGVICIVTFISLIIFLYFLFATSNLEILVFFIYVPFLAVLGIIFAALSGKENAKKSKTLFLTFDIIALVISIITYPIAGFKMIFSPMGPSTNNRAAEKATIENVMSLIPEKNLALNSKDTDDSFWYFDDDGSIAKQFLSMEFTLSGSSTTSKMSDKYFSFGNGDIVVTFTSDFDGILIHAIYESFFGYSEAASFYTTDPIEGKKLEKMINDKVDEQKTAYETKEAEEKATTTLTSVLEAMNEGEPSFQCTLLDKKYEVGLTRKIDDKKEIFAALQALDTSSFSPFTGEISNTKSGFYYNNVKKSTYYIMYYDKDRCLVLERQYVDPYGKNRKLYIYYSLTEEDGAHIMNVARKVIEEKEQSK